MAGFEWGPVLLASLRMHFSFSTTTRVDILLKFFVRHLDLPCREGRSFHIPLVGKAMVYYYFGLWWTLLGSLDLSVLECRL